MVDLAQMKKLILLAVWLLVNAASAQIKPNPPKKKRIQVVKTEYTKSEKRQHAVISFTIVGAFIGSMVFIIWHGKKGH